MGLVIAGAPDPSSTERLPAGVRSYQPLGSSAGHVQELLRKLETAQGRGPTLMASALDFAAEKAGRRALIIVISDLFDATERTAPALKMLRGRRHDVLLLQTLDREELDFPFEDPTRFLSMEDDRQIQAQPRQIRESYLEELRKFLDGTRRDLARADVEVEQIATDMPPDRVLLKLLSRREG